MVSRDRAHHRARKPPSLYSRAAPPRQAWSNPSSRRSWRSASSGVGRTAGESAKSGHISARSSFPTSWSRAPATSSIATERPKLLGDPIRCAGHGLGVAPAAEEERLEPGLPREGHRRERDADRVSDLFGSEQRHGVGDAGNRSVAASLPGAENRDGQAEVALDGARQVRAAERPSKACGFERSLERRSERGHDVELSERRPEFARPAYCLRRAGRRLRRSRLVRTEGTLLPGDAPARDHRREGVDRARIDRTARPARGGCTANAPSAPIPRRSGRSGGDRHERVANGDDATRQGNRLTAKSVGVAIAVPPLMMGSHQRRRLGHSWERLQQFSPEFGMPVQQRPVLGRQRTGSEHHRVRQLDHPDVPHLSTDIDSHPLGAAETELTAHLSRELANQRRAGVLGWCPCPEGRLPTPRRSRRSRSGRLRRRAPRRQARASRLSLMWRPRRLVPLSVLYGSWSAVPDGTVFQSLLIALLRPPTERSPRSRRREGIGRRAGR